MTTIALITGANKGIGFATARLLGARGITVLAGARDESRGRLAERDLVASGADARFVPLDVTDDKSVARAAEWIDAEYGVLDILVNNAGIARGDGRGRPSETTLGTLRAVYETNVFGVVAVTNAMLPLLRRSPAPRIVNVSSHAASLTITSDPAGPFATATLLPSAAYTPSKSALTALTVQYANELRKDGILVNAVAPGYVDTDSNNHTGILPVAKAAAVLVRLATLGADGPTAGFFSEEGQVPW